MKPIESHLPTQSLGILVVEDNAADADLIRELLPARGPVNFRVDSVARLSAALTRLRGSGIDLVLLDLGLPDSQGLQTLRDFRAAAAEVAVVVLTGNEDRSMGLVAVQEGAQDFLVKGQITSDLLERSIRYALGRHNSAAALRRSEERYRLAEHATHDGLWDWNLLTGEDYFSPRWKAILGYRDDEIANQRSAFLNLLHPDDQTRVDQATRGQMEKGNRYEVEFRLRHRDGSYRWVLSRGEAVRNAEGHPIRMVGSITDITERKRMERALKTICACDQALVLATSEPELLQKVCRVIIEQGGYRMTWVGFAENDEAKSIRVAAVAGQEDGYLSEAKISWAAANGRGQGPTGQAWRTGQTVICQDFRTDPNFAVWREAAEQHGYGSSASLPLLHAGKSFGILTIYAAEAQAFQPAELALLTALSEDLAYGIQALRMRLEHQQAEKLNARLAAIVEFSSDAIISKDLAGIIQSWNQGAEAIFGYSACEMIGASIRKLIPEDRQQEEDQILRQLLAGEPTNHYETIRQTKDGRIIPVSISVSPIKDKAGGIIGASKVLRDITERRRMEKRMLQAQKMEAIGTLAGGIAHDFNNMLAAMFGYAYLLQQDTLGNPQAQENVAEILTAANRAKELVQQILTFSRQRDQKPQVIKLEPVIKEVAKFLRASLPAQIKIEKELAADTPAVLADSTQIYQVTMNLATNALHAMEDNPGRLLLRLDSVLPAEPFLRTYPQLKPILYARLTVADTGHGMDAKTLEQIFEPFFTTKPVGKGTGLGLALVQGIVESYQGVITVESQVGQGTTFSLYFPAQAHGESPSDTHTKPVPRGHGQRLLAVDDEPGLTTVLQKMLHRLDYHVSTCNQASEAVRLVRENPEHFDLVITDLTMPEMNGLELAKQIRAIRSDLPVVLVSGYSAAVDTDGLRAAGVCERLEKPVAPSQLAEVVARALKRV